MMLTDDVVLALIGQIYDAALDSDLWPAFLQRLTAILGAAAAHLVYLDAAQAPAALGAAVGSDPELQKAYASRYAAMDPWIGPGREHGLLRTGGAGISDMLVPYTELRRTEFYEGFAKPMCFSHGMTGMILVSGPKTAGISVGRTHARGPYAQSDLAVIRELLPHLRRALFIHARMAGMGETIGSLETVLGLMTAGVALLDRRGRITWMNDRAGAIVARDDGLGCRARAFVPALPHERRRLSELVCSALALRAGTLSRGGGMMAVSRPSGRRSIVVTVTPIALPASAHRGGPAMPETPVVAVFLQDPDGLDCGVAQLLSQVYGLSAAEQRVALLLVGGDKPDQIAAKLGLGLPTVRTHLRHIFAKTNTKGQTEFVRLLTASQQPVASR